MGRARPIAAATPISAEPVPHPGRLGARDPLGNQSAGAQQPPIGTSPACPQWSSRSEVVAARVA